jgi:hypothetical protein
MFTYPSVLPLSGFLVAARLDDVRRSVRTVIVALIVAKWTNDVRVHDFAKRVRVALASALAGERELVEATGTFW